ncbi:acyltransferase family protein [Pedobacter psychroterrae]|uniref:Acyltransferase n=1 Tax=Pedobacter psychroterrae TaxID=2530453 RepID=A0A4R0N9D2_9SPHI|nr:acyltransferase [Pedobacter psychroterrae]TCC96809.1 acyltransferase [Pedobacter psychroterrae]
MKFGLVQVLRGVAAILVIIYHFLAHIEKNFHQTLYNHILKFGLVGVDFFFVLSGFIITYVHYKDLISKKGSKLFFKKRFIRIYPLYWLIAAMSVVIFIFFTPNRMKAEGLTMDLSSPYILTSLLQSFLLIPQKGLYLVGVAWTLSYEVLFYLLFGLGIKLGYRFSKMALLTWFLLIVCNALFIHSANFYIEFLLNPIIIEFMMGCLVAYAIIHRLKIADWLLYILLFLLIIASGYFLQFDGLRLERNVWYVLLLGTMFSIVTYTAVRTDIKYPKLRYPAIALLLGDASYSIYLFHQTLYNILLRGYQKITTIIPLSLSVVLISMLVITLTLAISIAIHIYIEKKILRYLKGQTPRSTLSS